MSSGRVHDSWCNLGENAFIVHISTVLKWGTVPGAHLEAVNGVDIHEIFVLRPERLLKALAQQLHLRPGRDAI